MGIKQSSLQARNTLKSQKCRMCTHYLITLHTEKLQQKYTGSICVHITHIHTHARAHTHLLHPSILTLKKTVAIPSPQIIMTMLAG